MSLTLLDSLTLDHPGSDTRTLSLYQGDITALEASEQVDYICVSALPGDYSPTSGSVIADLAAKGVSLATLAGNKAADFEPTMPCWITQDVSSVGLNFNRVVVFEPSDPANNAGWDIGMIYRAVNCFQGTNASSIALPMVSTGSGGADLSVILRQLFFDGAHWASRNNWQLSDIKLIAYSQAHADAAKAQFATMKQQYQNPSLAAGGATAPSGMSQRQCNCIRGYTTSNYRLINKALRAKSLTDSNYINYIATIEGISSGLANMTNWTGAAKRGTNLPQSVINEYKVGAIIAHDSFTSTSTNSPWGGTCYLQIQSVTGKSIASISQFPSENEVLFDKAMTDKVTQVAGAGSGYQYRFYSDEDVPNYCGS